MDHGGQRTKLIRPLRSRLRRMCAEQGLFSLATWCTDPLVGGRNKRAKPSSALFSSLSVSDADVLSRGADCVQGCVTIVRLVLGRC